MLHQSMSQLPSKPGILSFIIQLLVIEWTNLECYFMEKSWWLSYLGSMFLEIFNRTSYCKDTNGFMQKYDMCHVCLQFLRKWLQKCTFFNGQHWKSSFCPTYPWNKNFSKARPWGLRPSSKRVVKSTNLWTSHQLTNLDGRIFWGIEISP